MDKIRKQIGVLCLQIFDTGILVKEKYPEIFAKRSVSRIRINELEGEK